MKNIFDDLSSKYSSENLFDRPFFLLCDVSSSDPPNRKDLNDQRKFLQWKSDRQWSFADLNENRRTGKIWFSWCSMLSKNHSFSIEQIGRRENWRRFLLSNQIENKRKFLRFQPQLCNEKKRLFYFQSEQINKDRWKDYWQLFARITSDVHQRSLNCRYLLQSIVVTEDFQINEKVFQWIKKRFRHEQILVLEQFWNQFISFDRRFQLTILPKISSTIESISNHFQSNESLLFFSL